MMATSSPPFFLLASPVLSDGFFERSVIMLVEYGDEGAIGFVLNRRLELQLGDLSTNLKMPIRQEYRRHHVFLGGPVAPQRGWIVAKRNEYTPTSLRVTFETDSGLILLTDMKALQRLLITPHQQFKLILGYAGWGERQLDEELKACTWLPYPYDESLVFDPKPTGMWKKILEADGLDASMIWSRPVHDG